MSTTAASLPAHPVAEALAAAASALDGAVDPALWSLDADALADLTVAGHEVLGQLQGLLVRLIGEMDARGAAQEVGASSTLSWLVDAVRLRPGAAKTAVDVARAVRSERTATANALEAGRISIDHAAAIVRSIDDLPPETPPDVTARAEHVLVEQC